jgi:uncharacterized protein YjiS (DUF1127 family)
MEPAMSNDHSRFDASAWRALTAAQQGAQIKLLAQREHRARSRAIGNAVLEAVCALRGAWPRALLPLALPASARCRQLAPAVAARKGFLNISLSSIEFQRRSAWRHAWPVIRSIRSVWTRYRRYRRRRRDLAELASMDDRSLRDIGLSRTEIRAAIWEGTELPGRFDQDSTQRKV